MKGSVSNRNGNSEGPSPSLLFHAEATDPDMLYFSRFNAFDPYLAFSVGGKRVAVTHAGEHQRW